MGTCLRTVKLVFCRFTSLRSHTSPHKKYSSIYIAQAATCFARQKKLKTSEHLPGSPDAHVFLVWQSDFWLAHKTQLFEGCEEFEAGDLRISHTASLAEIVTQHICCGTPVPC